MPNTKYRTGLQQYMHGCFFCVSLTYALNQTDQCESAESERHVVQDGSFEEKTIVGSRAAEVMHCKRDRRVDLKAKREAVRAKSNCKPSGTQPYSAMGSRRSQNALVHAKCFVHSKQIIIEPLPNKQKC